MAKRRVWYTLGALGLDAEGRHTLRGTLARLGAAEYDHAQILAQLRTIMRNSGDLTASWPSKVSQTQPVLVWTYHGGGVNLVEGILAWALRLRGTDVRIVVCDRFLPICENRSINQYPGARITAGVSRHLCDDCYFLSSSLFEEFGLPIETFSAYADEDDVQRAEEAAAALTREELFSLTYRGIRLGPMIEASAARFFLRVHFPQDPQTEEALRRFAVTAMLVTDIANRVFDQVQPRALLTSHGIYVGWGVVTEVARQRGIPATVWAMGYRRNTMLFSQGANYFEEMDAESVSNWLQLELTPERRQRLETYLGDRWGSQDSVVLYTDSKSLPPRDLAAAGIDPAKPTLGVFPNVPWDAHGTQRNIAFGDVFEWVFRTIEYFMGRPAWQLVVRAHPMEGWLGGGANESITGEVRRRFPQLPGNIIVVPSNSRISSYSLASYLRAGAVHGTQFGLELACKGIPVIVSGGATYRLKGFTYDVDTAAQYFAALDQLDRLPRLTPEQRDLALKHAYHVYFRRLIPFAPMDRVGIAGVRGLCIESLHDLLPGRDRHLDCIVSRIGTLDAILDETS